MHFVLNKINFTLITIEQQEKRTHLWLIQNQEDNIELNRIIDRQHSEAEKQINDF